METENERLNAELKQDLADCRKYWTRDNAGIRRLRRDLIKAYGLIREVCGLAHWHHIDDMAHYAEQLALKAEQFCKENCDKVDETDSDLSPEIERLRSRLQLATDVIASASRFSDELVDFRAWESHPDIGIKFIQLKKNLSLWDALSAGGECGK